MTDREQVIKGLEKIVDDDWMWKHADFYASVASDAIDLLINIPEVVCCKDCVHCYVITPAKNTAGPYCKCTEGNGVHELDWYCADGRKKDGVSESN